MSLIREEKRQVWNQEEIQVGSLVELAWFDRKDEIYRGVVMFIENEILKIKYIYDETKTADIVLSPADIEVMTLKVLYK